jgi:hypothetical protein
MMEWAASNKASLRSMGTAAARRSRDFTHQNMHRKRSEIIAREFQQNRTSLGNSQDFG